MDEEFIKFLGRATAYLFVLSLTVLSVGIDKIKKQTDDEKIREDLEQEEWLSKLKRRKEKKNDTGRKN